MEEQRISRMYLTLLKQRLEAMWRGVAGDGQRGSRLPLLAALVVIGLPGGAYLAHRHAKFHSLEQKIQGVPQEDSGPRPGGREPMVLRRTATPGTGAPEFLSVTLLPGLGMDVLQVTAALPGQGEVGLLSAPTTAEMPIRRFSRAEA